MLRRNNALNMMKSKGDEELKSNEAPIKDGEDTVDRGARGRFVAGNKASPGRPPGRGVVAELREKLAQDVDNVIKKLREKALEGDPAAIRILLDRVVPSLRPVEPAAPMELPDGDLAQQARAVVLAVANGELASGQAA